MSVESADVRNHNPNKLQFPFSKEDLAAAFLVGTFSKKHSRHRADDRIYRVDVVREKIGHTHQEADA
jgi:hypothetical protein